MADKLLSLRFQKKEFVYDDNSQVDYLFKGIRCTEDVAYCISFMLGQLLGLDQVCFEVEDDEDVEMQVLNIPQIQDEEIWSEINDDRG